MADYFAKSVSTVARFRGTTCAATTGPLPDHYFTPRQHMPLCRYCGTPDDHGKSNCKNCGAPLMKGTGKW